MASNGKMKTLDRVGIEALAWLGFAGFVYFLTLEFDKPLPIFRLGAAFWPQAVAIGTAIAAVVLLLSRFIRGVESDNGDGAPSPLDDLPADTRGVSTLTLAMFVLPMAWVFAMHEMGFLLTTPFFLFGFTWLMGVRRWRTLLGFSLGFYAVLVLVFYVLIFTPLPMGGGWFHMVNGEIIALMQ